MDKPSLSMDTKSISFIHIEFHSVRDASGVALRTLKPVLSCVRPAAIWLIRNTGCRGEIGDSSSLYCIILTQAQLGAAFGAS